MEGHPGVLVPPRQMIATALYESHEYISPFLVYTRAVERKGGLEMEQVAERGRILLYETFNGKGCHRLFCLNSALGFYTSLSFNLLKSGHRHG